MKKQVARGSRKKTRQLSDGGRALFLTLLLAPILWKLAKVTVAAEVLPPVWIDLLKRTASFIFFAGFLTLFWFGGLRPLWANGLWRSLRTWYEGLALEGLLLLFFAVFIFATGETPSRYNHQPVPRSFGLHFLFLAIPFLAGSALCFVAERRIGKKS